MAEPNWLDRALIASPHLALCCSEAEYHDALYDLGLKPTDGGTWLTAGGTTHTFEIDGKTTCLVCIDLEKDGKRPLDHTVCSERTASPR